jgi:hypothetical protein
MSIKKIIDEFSKNEPGQRQRTSGDGGPEAAKIEKLQRLLNACFADIILPAVFDVENDLNQAGYWNRLNIGQSTSPTSGKPDIKEVSLFFYPERTDRFSYDPAKIDTSYKAHIRASGNLREIAFSIQFPQRIPPAVAIDDEILKVAVIDADRVNRFLEIFVQGALDAYNSDRMLR